MDSNNIILKKKNKEKLSFEEIEFMVNGYINSFISESEMIEFIKLIYNDGLSSEETYFLTDIMVKSGEIIDLTDVSLKSIDKHSSGGVGDKVTLLISPIVASLGYAVPKMSGRSLGLTGGTVDKLESINGYKLNLSKEEFITQLNEIGVSVISQSDNIALADKKIYALRDEIGAVDSIPLIASSIMSKKIACGTDSIVIDLKVGSGAFMKTIEDARALAKTMISIGKSYNKNVACMLTNMDSPLGYSVGNALEVKEVIDFFNGVREKRLYELVVNVSALMISITENLSMEECTKMVKEVIENGQARNKFYEWIKYQGGNINSLKDNSSVIEIKSNKSGFINAIDAYKISKLVYDLGAGRERKEDSVDYAVGIKLSKSLGEEIKTGETIGKIYYNKTLYNMEDLFLDSFTITEDKRKIDDIIIETILE